MTMLSVEALARAQAFMRSSARPLERALFEHAVHDAAIAPAREALRSFQNEDGGFGHGLEPDATTPTSGALATSLGLRYLGMLDVGADDPSYRAALAWLRATIDPDALTWRIVPEDADRYPHAPWWASEGLAERFGHFRVNPRAELVAAFYRYPGLADAAWLEPLAEDTVGAIEAGLHEMHDLLAALALLASPGLPAALRARVRAACEAAATATVDTDPARWLGYGLQPLKVAPRPNSTLRPLFADVLDANLDHLVASQGEDGAWHPAWSWLDYPEAWRAAEVAWSGVLTYEALTALRAYGRVAGVPPAEG